MSSTKMIVLKSSDGVSFEVEELVALESQTIKHMMTEDNYAENGILLPNVSSGIMPKVIEYCKRHVEAAKLSSAEGATDEKLKTFDAEFVKVDTCTLLNLFLAAYNLNITSLYDLTSQTIGDMMIGKTPQEIRKTFNIKNDFTIEEEEEIVGENAWAFE